MLSPRLPVSWYTGQACNKHSHVTTECCHPVYQSRGTQARPVTNTATLPLNAVTPFTTVSWYKGHDPVTNTATLPLNAVTPFTTVSWYKGHVPVTNTATLPLNAVTPFTTFSWYKGHDPVINMSTTQHRHSTWSSWRRGIKIYEDEETFYYEEEERKVVEFESPVNRTGSSQEE